MICSGCQQAVPPQAAFCPRCGRRAVLQTPRPAPVGPVAQTMTPASAPKAGAGPAILLSIALLIIGSMIGALFFGSSHPISHPVQVPTIQTAPPVSVQGPPLGQWHSYTTIRDANGNEITDPQMRARIEAAIQESEQKRAMGR